MAMQFRNADGFERCGADPSRVRGWFWMDATVVITSSSRNSFDRQVTSQSLSARQQGEFPTAPEENLVAAQLCLRRPIMKSLSTITSVVDLPERRELADTAGTQSI